MPIPDVVRAELERYLIGQKLKALRLRRSMGLAQLGERTSLSPALLSKIENGRLLPTLPTLLRIAMVFDVTLDHFFQNDFRQRVMAITRKKEQEQRFSFDATTSDCYQLTRLDLGSGDRKFHPYLAEFLGATAENGKAHMHQGVEFIHILRGTLQMVIGPDAHVLRCGDSIYFDSSLRHSYKRLGDEPCVGFMVFAYPEKDLAERRMEKLQAARSVRAEVNPALVRHEAVQNIAINGNDIVHPHKTPSVQGLRHQPAGEQH